MSTTKEKLHLGKTLESGLESAFSRKDIFDKQAFLRVLVATLLIGLLAHGYCYFNSLYFFDALAAINQQTDTTHKIQLGRYFQLINMFLRGYIVAPWLIGMLALLWTALSCYLIAKLLEFKSKISEILLCGLIVTNFVFTLTNASYLHESDAFMIALFFSVLAVFIHEKYRYGFLIAPFCILVSCGFYQAFFAVTVSLFMIVILKDIFEGMQPQKVVEKAVKVIVVMLAGIAIYYGVYQLVLLITGLAVHDTGNSVTHNIFASGGLNEILAAIGEAYRCTLDSLYNLRTYNRAVVRLFTTLFGLIAFGCFFFTLKGKKINIANIVLSLCILALFPFATGLIFFLAAELSTDLMLYAWIFVFVLGLFVIDYFVNRSIFGKFAKGVAGVCLAVFIFSNIVFSNQAYVLRVLQYQSTLSTMTRILTQMEYTEGYVVGETDVLFIGEFNSSALTTYRNGFGEIYGSGLYSLSPIHADSSLSAYFEYILAYPIDLVDDDTAYQEMQAVIDMPAFPAAGSVQFIDEVLVVKLSD